MPDVAADHLELSLGFSPDADDAAMWWPVLDGESAPPTPEGHRGLPVIDTGPFHFRAVREDIESLNRRSLTGELDITAMSCAQFAYVADTYAITMCGCSMGDRFGPKLVARPGVSLEMVKRGNAVVAVPGERTTAFAALSVLLGPEGFEFTVAPFDRILGMVERGEVAAGLLIHETQLSFREHGLEAIADVAQLWSRRFGLPLPLGINTIRKDLDEQHGAGTLERATAVLRRSIEYSMVHQHESFAIARRASGALLDDRALGEYLARYVNAWTLSLGPVGRLAVERLLGEASRIGLAPMPASIDFIEPSDRHD
jgi:1,4-dihydroxy-6-naphthoate synthase